MGTIVTLMNDFLIMVAKFINVQRFKSDAVGSLNITNHGNL